MYVAVLQLMHHHHHDPHLHAVKQGHGNQNKLRQMAHPQGTTG